ncbi:MAG: SDR family NAD(P)-dependent oxidoreductase, partial [Elusimicrobia bacterium]|nr:SDR family NAD(P)-dependent oxidoreductase [Elusimicrobiota bacterium]
MNTFSKDLLAGRVAVVTGGGTGIGLVVARELAAHGADVVLASRDGARLETAARSIAADTGRKALGVSTDVSDMDSVKALFERVDAEFGRVDIL